MIHPEAKRPTAISRCRGGHPRPVLAIAQPGFGSQIPGAIAPQAGDTVVLSDANSNTTTPIQHLVVIFDDNSRSTTTPAPTERDEH